VQGILLQSIEGQGHITSVDLATRGRGALVMGAFLPRSFGKSPEELALYTGSIILYLLLYLML
jgi:hypothetical protein